MAYQTTPNQVPLSIGPLMRVTELNPSFPFGHSSLADSLVAVGRIDEAIVEYGKAIELLESAEERDIGMFYNKKGGLSVS